MDNLKRLLSTLILYSHNVKMLHWKVSGLDFDPVHSKLEKYYQLLENLTDEVAEIGLQLDVNPVGLLEAVSFLEKDEEYNYEVVNSYEKIDSRTAFEKVGIMFNTLIKLYERVYSSEDISPDIANKLQEHSFMLRKEALYKNKQRLS